MGGKWNGDGERAEQGGKGREGWIGPRRTSGVGAPGSLTPFPSPILWLRSTQTCDSYSGPSLSIGVPFPDP